MERPEPIRAMIVMRFVVLGAVGFGIGGAIGTSLPNPLPLRILVGGATGGASLGLALKDWRRVIVLAVLGIVGLTVGVFAAMLLGSFFNSAAGAVGFGIGLVGGGLLRASIPAIRGVGSIAVTGIIGGASLGAALGYLEYRKLAAQRRPRVQMNLRAIWERVGLRPWMLAVLLAGFAVVLVGGVLIGAPLGGVCTDEERNDYAEFPQYQNIHKEPQPDTRSGACIVVYDTRASQEQVAEYYAQQLKAHGWAVKSSKQKAAVS